MPRVSYLRRYLLRRYPLTRNLLRRYLLPDGPFLWVAIQGRFYKVWIIRHTVHRIYLRKLSNPFHIMKQILNLSSLPCCPHISYHFRTCFGTRHLVNAGTQMWTPPYKSWLLRPIQNLVGEVNTWFSRWSRRCLRNHLLNHALHHALNHVLNHGLNH